jgi:small subunit ribosomal protein S9
MPETQRPNTGRRKEATARVRLVPGTGNRTVNNRPFREYFFRSTLVADIERPLLVTNLSSRYDVIANVRGGGTSGQAGAVRMGVARALVQIDPALKPVLSREGFLRRDARMKERKKYGQAGARKRFQFSKR